MNKEKKHKELDRYLKYFFSQFTKEEKKRWVDDNIDLLKLLSSEEK